MSETYYIVSPGDHNNLVNAAYRSRGYTESEAGAAARFCEMASTYGIRTHNAIKALHLDHLFGSEGGGCVPGATLKKLPCRFKASEIWDARLKLGQPVAYDAMQRCMELADEFGIGQVSVDNAFHYLWGGGYVMDAALKTKKAGGLLFTAAEIESFGSIARECGRPEWDTKTLESLSA